MQKLYLFVDSITSQFSENPNSLPLSSTKPFHLAYNQRQIGARHYRLHSSKRRAATLCGNNPNSASFFLEVSDSSKIPKPSQEHHLQTRGYVFQQAASDLQATEKQRQLIWKSSPKWAWTNEGKMTRVCSTQNTDWSAEQSYMRGDASRGNTQTSTHNRTKNLLGKHGELAFRPHAPAQERTCICVPPARQQGSYLASCCCGHTRFILITATIWSPCHFVTPHFCAFSAFPPNFGTLA